MEVPLGVVLRRRPGVTRWAKWAWTAVSVIPNAGPGGFRVLREDGDITDFHAATVPMDLHHTEVESYRTSLMMTPPSVFVVLNKGESADNVHGIDVHLVTASADRAQEWQDSDEMIVEPVAMPDVILATVRDFCEAHYKEVAFVKRKRDRQRTDLIEDGIGDARIRQAADVYRSPTSQKQRSGDD
ncbi:MAG: DUF3305 domain-containing protein [Silicimonas sp.]|nr:DUF3305 domain-containing protein [Silicimonas sp.]